MDADTCWHIAQAMSRIAGAEIALTSLEEQLLVATRMGDSLADLEMLIDCIKGTIG